jgi:hypothetical protein
VQPVVEFDEQVLVSPDLEHPGGYDVNSTSP